MIALRRDGRTLARDEAGLALVEFAMTLPVLLILYLGGYLLMDAMACNRKVTVTARAAADLVSRSSTSTIAASDIDGALSASAQIMYPFKSSKALVRVSEISTDNKGNSTVTWSRAINGSPLLAASAFSVPASIRNNNTSLIYSEVIYTYTPPVASFRIASPNTLTQTVFLSPRSFAKLTCQDC